MNIGEFTLVNPEKLDRALNGVQLANSSRVGGVGNGAYNENGVWKRNGEELSKEDVSSLEKSLLAEYDRLGGLIRKGGDKVKTGSFYSFTGRKPREKAEVVLTFMINGKQVEVKDGEDVPPVVRAAQQLQEEESEEKPKRRKK